MIRTYEGTFLSCSMILGAPVFVVHNLGVVLLKDQVLKEVSASFRYYR